MDISARLRELRSSRNFTQREVCKSLRIAERVYQRWEAGQTPSIQKLVLLADFFNVSLDYLVGRKFPKDDG